MPSCIGPHGAGILFFYVDMEIMLVCIVVYTVFFIQIMDNLKSDSPTEFIIVTINIFFYA
jgi:hypothetical protein